jgi:hypothetical protein
VVFPQVVRIFKGLSTSFNDYAIVLSKPNARGQRPLKTNPHTVQLPPHRNGTKALSGAVGHPFAVFFFILIPHGTRTDLHKYFCHSESRFKDTAVFATRSFRNNVVFVFYLCLLVISEAGHARKIK